MAQEAIIVKQFIHKSCIIGISSCEHRQRFLIGVKDKLAGMKLCVKRFLKCIFKRSLGHNLGASENASRFLGRGLDEFCMPALGDALVRPLRIPEICA